MREHMARKAMRLYKAVTRAEQRRDEIEMQSINRLLSNAPAS